MPVGSMSFDEIRSWAYSAVFCDVLDSIGLRSQSPRVQLRAWTTPDVLVGRCKTTSWEEVDGEDPRPYELELQAVDACQPDDILVCAAGGSRSSGIWGELLSTAAMNQGCIGAVVDGCVRDTCQMTAMGFPVYAIGTSIYDSLHRQRVTAIDVPVEIGGVEMMSGDLLIVDADGAVVVPRGVEQKVTQLAFEKVHDENVTRDAIRGGMKATEAYEKYGVL
jgi:4-hydroxy-4-methyl-2-oxoglutarate aldolase